jgi:hypothetical protein
MKVLFTISFLLGVLVRSLSSELHVTQIGNVLIMIAVFGGLLLMGKRMRVKDFRTASEPLRLGLRSDPDSIPLAFDEKGRTPFERVRGTD